MLTSPPPPPSVRSPTVKTSPTGLTLEPPGKPSRKIVVASRSEAGPPDPGFTCTIFRPDGLGRAVYEVQVGRLLTADMTEGAFADVVLPAGIIVVRRLERQFACPVSFPFPFVPARWVKDARREGRSIATPGPAMAEAWHAGARDAVRGFVERHHFEARWRSVEGDEAYFFPENRGWYDTRGRLLAELPGR